MFGILKKLKKFLMNVPDFKNMNEYSGLLKNEYLFWMYTLDLYKMKKILEQVFWFWFARVKNGCRQMSQTYLKPFRDH